MIYLAYSDRNFNTMQEDAIRRVREMQKRSQEIVSDSDNEKENPPENENHTNENTSVRNQSKIQNNRTPIKIDEEKALIGMLIYILYKQGADIKLLLALGYLLI